jgi:hypothetical protein
MYKTCPDCGCRVYNGHCVNCHEETYIMQQYHEDGINHNLSEDFVNKVKEQEVEAKRIRKEHKQSSRRTENENYS